MPHKPKRPCRYPGCPNLCETGTYCEVHRKEWSPESLRGNAAAREGCSFNEIRCASSA